MKTSPASRIHVDMGPLWKACAHQFVHTNRDAKHTALDLGFTPAVFTGNKQAALNGRTRSLSADVLLTICWWLGRNPMDFATLPVLTPEARP